MIRDSPSNLVTSAGGSGELGQAVRPCGAAGCPRAQQQQGTVLPSVGAGCTCPRASWGSLTHSIDEGSAQDTHQPENCTGCLKVHQQGSLMETSS